MRIDSEKALERDYFMTGKLWAVSLTPHCLLTLLRKIAKEALDFGIVDSILERRVNTN